MKKLLIVFTCIVLCYPVNAQIAKDIPSQTSLDFVETFSKQHFYSMASKAALRTQTFQIIIASKPLTGEALFRKNLRESIDKHYPEWKRNNAIAWESVLSKEEMKSLTKDQKKSPYLEKMIKHQPEAGEVMKELSSSVLADALSEALIKSFEEVTKEN